MGEELTQWSYGKRAGAALAVIVAAGLLVGLGMLVADDGAELAAQQQSWEAELAASQARADEAEAEVASAEERADEAEAEAQRRMEAELEEREAELEEEADEQLADREAELERRTDDLDARKQKLDQRASDLDDRAAEIEADVARIERVMQNEFGDGTWEVGVDIEPGRYRIDPGDGCYWARLRSRGGGVNAIIDNNNARGGQEIVEIAASDSYFESVRCGTWTPID